MEDQPTVLDVLAEFSFGVRDTVNDAPSPVDYDLAKAFSILNGIPAGFPAADLPKAIAMWQRAQACEFDPAGAVAVNGKWMAAGTLLDYLTVGEFAER